jgi:medium-chain acyl-[acyl-carrier-protein] hydrolase
VLAGATWDRVRPSDIDRNAHVNNARYVQWLSDWAPELVSVERPGMFTFTAETRAGQEFAVISGEARNEAVAEVWVRDRGTAPDTAVCACRFNRLVPDA